jgi:hypothetical protein
LRGGIGGKGRKAKQQKYEKKQRAAQHEAILTTSSGEIVTRHTRSG